MAYLLGMYLGIASRLEIYEKLSNYQKKEVSIILIVNMLLKKYLENKNNLYNDFINENFDKLFYENLGIKLDEILYFNDEHYYETLYMEFLKDEFNDEFEYQDRLRLTEYIFKIYQIDRGQSLTTNELKYLILKLKCRKSDIVILLNKYKVD